MVLTVLVEVVVLDFQLELDLNDVQFWGHCILEWETFSGIFFSVSKIVGFLASVCV